MSWTKQQSRRYFLEERTSITSADTERWSRLIASQLPQLLVERSVRYLHSFLADGFRKEVDTFLLHQLLSSKLPELVWVAPRIIPDTHLMDHFVWDDATTFTFNRWGIREPDPITSQIIDHQMIDAILVPLLAYDQQGHRVGYGGGYYDRFLAECRPDALKIGVSFFGPIDAIIDVNAWDIKLDLCITPFTIHRWDH